MDIKQHWKTIRKIVNQANRSNRFCAVATVNPDGSPRISPIGSLILGEAGKAFYFEKFPKNMRENLDRDPRICVLAVCGGFWFWLKSLYRGRFDAHPGLRLMGRAGGRRMATQEEVKQWQKRVRSFRRFKGYELLWKDMRHVRDVTFDAAEPLRLGPMARGLWESEKMVRDRR
ncbi:MAG TPA: pyridoxamine 5'-phosphate oxidase family protein [Desulfobacteria bacterium]|nr:pyridoxamine 5'-phosphate oxidase family protein [Desulfobacteria bacterium]